MEFLKIIKRRSFLNEAVYVLLNIALAVALVIIIRTTGTLWLAFVVVLLSKWRVFAVRPRFWFANIQADLVSLIVSLGFVVFLYDSMYSVGVSDSQILITQIAITLLYICWLLFLKSQSKRIYVVSQAAVAVFVGITAIFSFSYGWIVSPVVVLAWLIGYASARHVLSSYDEEGHTLLISLIWGLSVAEISWLAYHWTIAYRLPFASNMMLPQVSIIILGLSFLAYKSYDSFHHHQQIRMHDVLMPLIFTVSIIFILLLFFNGVGTAIY